MAIVADHTASSNGSTSILTYNHVLGVASGNNRLVVVILLTYGFSQAVTGVTYNGSAMTAGPSLYVTQFGNLVGVNLYYLLDAGLPASTGTYAVAFTYSGILYDWSSGTQSASGVGQAAPQATTTNSQLTGSSMSTTLSSVPLDSWIFDGISVQLSTGSGTPGTGQTVIVNNNISSETGLGSYYPFSAGGSHAMSWTFNNTGSTCVHALASWQSAAALAGAAANAPFFGCNF